MSEPLRTGIIVGSTRPGRFADRPATWLLELARKRTDLAPELVDLRDYPLPFFDEPKSPLRAPSQHPVALRWAAKDQTANTMLDDLAWWGRALRSARLA